MSDEREPRHPMAVVVARTGLTPDALRVWERRYGVVAPGRGPGGHRLYSDADVARLQLLRSATAGGRRIGDVAELSDAQLAGLVEEDRRSTPAPVGGAGESGLELVHRGLALVRALDSAGLESLLRRALALLGARGFIDDVVVPLLHAIGDGWEEGDVSIAQEHMASGLVQDVLIEVMRATAARAGAPEGVLVMATPSGERHGIGALLAGVLAATAGWKVIDLGTDLPPAEIALAAVQAGAEVVALSLTQPPDAETLDGLREMRSELPAATEVVVGGVGLSEAGGQLASVGLRAVADLASFEALLARVSAAGRRRP